MAIQIANAARGEHAVPEGHVVRGAERRIIEVCSGAGAPVRDARVWIVRFQGGVAWVELAIDEASGSLVRVQRSRAP